MLSKKDYEKIAEILRRRAQRVPFILVQDFADWFVTDNPSFDRQKFYDACMLGKERSKP